MDTIFTIKNESLERLGPQEAVILFRDLLWAEARKIGIPISKIHISSWIDVPDGGIDAVVEGTIKTSGDLIKQGHSGYQIKAGASFKPWQSSQIKKALFDTKRPNKKNLGSSVRNCLDNDGTYVLVCFKQDLIDAQRRKAIGLIDYYFKQCGYPNPRVEVWSQSNLIGFLQIFPSLALKVNGLGRPRFQTHQSWSQDAEMKKTLVIGQTQKDRFSNIQKELRGNDEAVHVRIYGDPGIGKTRLVLEATREEDLQPFVIYCSAANFRDSELMNEILKEDNQFSVILVLDECDRDDRAYIWDKLKYRGPRIKVVSIYSEHDDTTGNISYFDTPPLDDARVSSIIQEYGVSKERADRWAELCSGSPRVAHVIGWNLRNNPDDLLKPPDTVNIWERYIVGGDDPNSEQVQQRRVVLRHLALFKRFGFGTSVATEAQAVAGLVQQSDLLITRGRFQEIVRNLKGRRILQGENTLYITPKALHIYLWKDWWDTYGTGFNFDKFSRDLPRSLREWFYEMFKYAAESQAASLVVKNLLGEGGPFQNDSYLKTKLGAKKFLALAEADPEAALQCLKKTVGTWGKERLLEFTTGRREVIWALEKVVMHRDLFTDAGRLLLALAEAENETWTNNASGVFSELFSPAPGAVAPTEASPEERFPLLKEAIESSSRDRRLLALDACNAALQTGNFVRMVGAEFQGLKEELKLWTPKTYGEFFDAYCRVWLLLVEKLENMEERDRQKAVDILLRNARGLGVIPNLSGMIIDTLTELSQKTYVKRESVIRTVVEILHYDRGKLSPDMRKRWEKIRDEITGDDFSSLLRRYVGMDLIEDQFDDKGNHIDQTQLRIAELAKEAADNEKLLRADLDWLVAADTQNCYRFGYELGKIDMSLQFLSIILEAQRRSEKSANMPFLGGYFRALFERDQQRWEQQLELLAQDKRLNVWVPELTWRSGMSDQAAVRVLHLVKQNIIALGQLLPFGFGFVMRAASEDVFKEGLEFLLASSDARAVSIALDVYHSYYIHDYLKHTLPQELTLKLLTHPLLLQKSEAGMRRQMDDFYWTEIGKTFVRTYPERSLKLAGEILQHFGEEGTIFEDYHSSTREVLNQITLRYPKEVWVRVTKYLGPPIDSRAFHIKNWLRGGDFFKTESEGVLSIIPVEMIWAWVDEDVGKRAWYLANFVPKTLFREEGRACLAREVLVRYGAREEVRRNLMANFSTEGWWGPASLHYQTKKRQLLDFRNDEDNENVKRWIDEYVASLDQQIQREKIEEEREE